MNNSIKYTINEEFCKSKKYFIAMARLHEFLKDVIVDDISDVKNDTMIKLLYTDNDSQMYSIIRLVVVLANNIDIQQNEIKIVSKLYKYLIQLFKENNIDKMGDILSPSPPSGLSMSDGHNEMRSLPVTKRIAIRSCYGLYLYIKELKIIPDSLLASLEMRSLPVTKRIAIDHDMVCICI